MSLTGIPANPSQFKNYSVIILLIMEWTEYFKIANLKTTQLLFYWGLLELAQKAVGFKNYSVIILLIGKGADGLANKYLKTTQLLFYKADEKNFLYLKLFKNYSVIILSS